MGSCSYCVLENYGKRGEKIMKKQLPKLPKWLVSGLKGLVALSGVLLSLVSGLAVGTLAGIAALGSLAVGFFIVYDGWNRNSMIVLVLMLMAIAGTISGIVAWKVMSAKVWSCFENLSAGGGMLRQNLKDRH